MSPARAIGEDPTVRGRGGPRLRPGLAVRELNHPLLGVGLMSDRHRAHQRDLGDVAGLRGADVEVITVQDDIAAVGVRERGDLGTGRKTVVGVEQIGRAEHLDPVGRAAGHHNLARR